MHCETSGHSSAEAGEKRPSDLTKNRAQWRGYETCGSLSLRLRDGHSSDGDDDVSQPFGTVMQCGRRTTYYGHIKEPESRGIVDRMPFAEIFGKTIILNLMWFYVVTVPYKFDTSSSSSLNLQ